MAAAADAAGWSYRGGPRDEQSALLGECGLPAGGATCRTPRAGGQAGSGLAQREQPGASRPPGGVAAVQRWRCLGGGTPSHPCCVLLEPESLSLWPLP